MLDRLNPERSGRSFVSDSITLKPGETRQLPLGAYSTKEAKPSFERTVAPDIGEQLGLSHEELQIPGSPRYILFYNLHNFSDKTCKVTVRRRDLASRD